MVKYGDGVWHCLHPEFLADQLGARSLAWALESLDVCLLHNPEYFLKDAHERSHGTLESRREEFDRAPARGVRLAGGRGRRPGASAAYGVSSNTVHVGARTIPSRRRSTRMLEAARQAGGAATISASCSSR